jgi:hypothetical protein
VQLQSQGGDGVDATTLLTALSAAQRDVDAGATVCHELRVSVSEWEDVRGAAAVLSGFASAVAVPQCAALSHAAPVAVTLLSTARALRASAHRDVARGVADALVTFLEHVSSTSLSLASLSMLHSRCATWLFAGVMCACVCLSAPVMVLRQQSRC